MKKIDINPSILVNEMFYCIAYDAGKLGEIIPRILEDGFYKSIEIDIVFDQRLARRLFEIADQSGIRIIEWMSKTLEDEDLSYSSLDEPRRRKSVLRTIDCLKLIADSGGSGVGVLSGQDPGEARREEARKRLTESLSEIGEAAAMLGLQVLLEPLDRVANKKHLIGPTDEAAALLETLRTDGYPIYLAWDSAHCALNEESMVEALTLSETHIAQAHLSNAILDRSDPNYGDRHIPYGPPGFLSDAIITGILRKLRSLRKAPFDSQYVGIEMRNLNLEEAIEMEKRSRSFLRYHIEKSDSTDGGGF